jgi:DNA-directed RNA polymerase subunit RPC12/RpoP
MPIQSPNVPGAGAARFIGGVFGFVFGGIGLTVLGFLWGSTGGDSPPLFFRIFGSFIALAFVAFGGTMFFAAITGRMGARPTLPVANPIAGPAPLPRSAPAGYVCSHCGAPLTEQADVSPLGDVKCPFCHAWFNIHQPAS